MSEQPQPTILVFCDDGPVLDRVREVAERAPMRGGKVSVAATWGDPAAVIRGGREHDGGNPMGIVVMDEAHALLAVEAGADEALVAGDLDEQTIRGFFDRILLRARLRREQEKGRTVYAHQEKLAALGTLVAGVAHEINNPLTALLLSTEGLNLRVGPLHRAYVALRRLLREDGPYTRDQLVGVLELGRTGAEPEECSDLLAEAIGGADAIARIVKDLTVFARQDDEGEPSVLDLTALLDQVVRMAGRQVRSVASIELDYPEETPVVVAPGSRLVQVFTNLLLNAAHAIAELPNRTHRIQISVRSDDDLIAVSFTDTGPGIAPRMIERIFDPFFTTKREGVGTGLGLSISRTILQRLGGDLLVESVHGSGATFIALIPAPDRTAIIAAKSRLVVAPGSLPEQRRSSRILVVDDDERVLRSFARSLDEQHSLLLAQDPAEALALLDSGSHADVVVADSSPPARMGVALFEQLRQRNSPLANALVLVVNPDEELDAAIVATGCPILTKPVHRTSLASAVARALDRRPK